jgi:hypothetical protein
LFGHFAPDTSTEGVNNNFVLVLLALNFGKLHALTS